MLYGLKITQETNVDKLSSIKPYSNGQIKHKPMGCKVLADLLTFLVFFLFLHNIFLKMNHLFLEISQDFFAKA